VRPYKGETWLIKFSDIADATAAEGYRNCEMYIPADQMAVLPPDSYYQHDILGIQVLTMTGADVGIIVDIMPTGSNDIYIVQSSSGKQVLIPAVKEFVKQVDLIRHVMYIEPIGGLIDDDAVDDESDASVPDGGE
jgi:16S rRNA processing protein RimM